MKAAHANSKHPFTPYSLSSSHATLDRPKCLFVLNLAAGFGRKVTLSSMWSGNATIGVAAAIDPLDPILKTISSI